MKQDIQEIINRLEVVFRESTLGDIPFIQADLRKLASQSIINTSIDDIKYRAELMEYKLSESQASLSLELIQNDNVLWEALAEAELEAIKEVTEQD